MIKMLYTKTFILIFLMSKKTIYLIDAYNLIYRLFFAVPPFTTKAGEPVNAVFGMAKSILGFHEYDQPDALYFILDAPGKTFREDLYADYKGTRDRMPDDLRSQEKRIFELLESMQIPLIKQEGFEADDIIGTLAKRFSEDPNTHTYIVSGDKDLYQCIGPNVSVYDTMKRRKAGREEAIEKF
jgi:DNA polymerase-1